MSEIKIIKKGQFLFKAGDKIQSVFVVQSGQINLCLQKNNKIIEIMTVGNGFVFADLVVLGVSQYLYSALAQQEIKYSEVPVDIFKTQYESLSPTNKSFIKTMADKLKWSVNEIKNYKQEKSAIPCSEESIPRVFGSLFHVLNHKGLKDGSKAKIDWQTLRSYSQRVFGESLKRLEQITQILIKLKLGEYVMGRDPNNPDSEALTEIQGFEIFDLPALEAFFEFYQYYYYKGGKTELLKYDESNYNTLRLLLMCYVVAAPDKFGIVSKNFNEVTDFFKEYGVNLGNGHFISLEGKGLFCKRKSITKSGADEKVELQFDIKEFKTQLDIWSLIREIDKLNEKGVVDLTEIDEGPKKKTIIANGVECVQCHAVIAVECKFCSECGAKVVNQANNATSSDKKTA
ncbi:MAG: cyclic nucleotide-binding domain-containing protein [Bdellovibrionota bacterium]